MDSQGARGHADGSPVAARLAMVAVVVVGTALGLALASQQSAASEQVSRTVVPDRAVAVGTQDDGAGSSVYAANCASCHQAGGTGVAGTFPPLAGNPNVADPAYVESVVRDGLSGPIDVNGEAFDSEMPALPQLSDTEVADVAAYVATLSEGGATEPTEPTEAPAEDGTVAGGEDLFIGSTEFENGGGACVGCHTAGSVGNLGGPGLGPDLTDAAETLGGAAGLSAWLTNPPAPTMTPIFAERPLTPSEIADLTAFLVDAPEQKAPSPSIDWLLVTGAVGLIVLIAGMAIAYRGMRQTYVERLRARTDARVGASTTRRTS